MYKRLAMSLLAVAAIAGLVAGGTFALFTANTTNTGNTFTAGTVTLGTVAETLIDVSNIAPGDFDDETYTVTYVGSLDAWLGIKVSKTGGLLTCDGANSLDFDVLYGSTEFEPPVGTDPVVVKKVVKDEPVTFNIHWDLPSAAGNSCQGDAATAASLGIQIFAVQAKNNSETAADVAVPYTDPTAVRPIAWQ